MTVKSKSSVKTKAAIKPNAADKLNKKISFRQNNFSHLAEEIISNVGVGIYIVQNGKFVYVSPLFQKLSGYSSADLIGTNPLDYISPDDREITRKLAIKRLKGKSSDAYEYRFIRKNGKVIWVLEMISSITYKGKRAALGSFMDITERKQTEETIRQSEERYRTILDEMADAYFEVDVAGNYTFVNDAVCRHLGYSREELIGTSFRGQMVKEEFEKVYKAFGKIYITGKPERGIFYKLIRKDGTTGFAEMTGFPLQNQKGEVIGFRGVGRDITERKKMEEALRQSEERYRTIIEEMEEWYFETDLAGKLLYFNDALVRALGYPQKELTGLNFRALIKQEQAEEIYKIFHQVYEIGEPIKNFPQEFVRPDGSITFAEFSIFPKRDHRGKIFGFRGVGHDITERKRVEQELSYMATHDPLTGLPNRMLFMDRLKMALAHAKRNKQKLAVMMLDLDHFKNINDTLGHMVGDRLLKEIGLRLTGLLRQSDTISRLGGDEFIILLPEMVRMEDPAEVAEKIINAIQQPFICDSHKLITSTSIGIAIYPDDCQDMDSLMKNADMAMYSVKAHGRNSYQFFTKTNFDQSG
jgi:diguanylate cyclase (GGDEF)-like protein/PAS domain S-box-containing protein